MTITALRVAVAVPRSHPAPERLRGAVDDALSSRLRAVLPSALRFAGLDRDPSVWLIRRLELKSSINAGWDEDALARAVAEDLSRSLMREVSGTGDGVNSVRFAGRAAQLADYLRERACGRAPQWYHERFAGLRALPASAALRTVILGEPALGWDALCLLHAADLQRVVAALSRADAGRVLDAFAAANAAKEASLGLLEIAQSWPRGAPPNHAYPEQDALALLVSSVKSRASACSPEAARLFAELLHAGSALGAQERRAWCASLAESGRLDVVQSAPTLVELSEVLASHPSVVRQAVCSALVATLDASPIPAEFGEFATRFGGAFLLLPELEAITVADLEPVAGAAAGAVDEAGVQREFGHPPEAERLLALRFLVLAHCLQPEAPHGVLLDPPLGWLFPSEEVRLRMDVHLGIAELSARVLRVFASRLPGFAGSGQAYLRAQFLAFPATVTREPARIVVRMGQAPLRVVLRLAGLLRRSYSLPWLPHTRLEIYPEE